MKRAVLSVWDKTGIEWLAGALTNAGYEILSTSKTATLIRNHGIAVTEIADYTGSPEILAGRVKTLHPKIAGGILTTREDDTVAPIDVVVCNLYPFEDGLKRGLGYEELIELIDIGGVTLLRAGAKNHRFVTVVPGVGWYDRVVAELERDGVIGPELRRELARAAFQITSSYDAAIAAWLLSSR